MQHIELFIRQKKKVKCYYKRFERKKKSKTIHEIFFRKILISIFNFNVDTALLSILGKYIVGRNTWQPERYFQTSQIALKQVLTKTLRIKHEDYYKRMDRVPQDYEMIYKFPLQYTMNFGKMLSVVVPVGLSYGLYTWLFSTTEAVQFVGSLAASEDQLLLFVMVLFGTNAIVYRVCDVLTLRIYRKDKSYIRIQPSMIPRYDIKKYFEEGQVKENFSAISVFRGLNYKINNKTALLVPDRFRKSSDLYQMLDVSDSKKYKPE